MQERMDFARAFADEHFAEALDLLRELARIPAPSHHEERRADFVRDWFERNDVPGTFVDGATNVILPVADDGKRGLVVFAAHTDVVFDDTDELPLREEGGRILAPGVGDDTANLVALLLCARHLARNPNILPEGLGALVVANSCEEGLGNLKGTRELFATYGSRIKRFYTFDGNAPGLVSTAVGSHRWRIEVRTQGGHSYWDFGRPNAIERLSALVADLYRMELPHNVPATLNVGTIEGGTSVNAIAARASCLFEYRSTSEEALVSLRERMEQVADKIRAEGVEVVVQEVGIRPASAGERGEALERMTQVSRETIRAVTGEDAKEASGSTDANVPLSLGIPANMVGTIRGGLAHTRDEWVEAESLREALALVLAVMCAQADLG